MKNIRRRVSYLISILIIIVAYSTIAGTAAVVDAAATAATTTTATTSTQTQQLPEPKRRALVNGYNTLDGALGGQGMLWVLGVVRKLTLSNREVDEVRDFAAKICNSGNRRKKEMKALRKLPPGVTGSYPRRDPDPMGEAIADIVKWAVFRKMLNRGDEFNLDFALLQVTATAAISATARAMIQFERNEQRKVWLKDVADEYRGHRKEIASIIGKYVKGEGAQSWKFWTRWGF